MSERRVLWIASLGLLVAALVFGTLFVLGGFATGLMFATAVCLFGSLMTFVVGFAA
jgi:hypothetical protein